MELKEYVYRPSHEECVSIFIASCIETAAKATGMSPQDMYLRMERIGLISEYIIPCYEQLHSESRKNITEDILKTIQIWEEKKFVKVTEL